MSNFLKRRAHYHPLRTRCIFCKMKAFEARCKHFYLHKFVDLLCSLAHFVPFPCDQGSFRKARTGSVQRTCFGIFFCTIHSNVLWTLFGVLFCLVRLSQVALHAICTPPPPARKFQQLATELDIKLCVHTRNTMKAHCKDVALCWNAVSCNEVTGPGQRNG